MVSTEQMEPIFNANRVVPTDLFPLTAKEFNLGWAKKTFRYAFLFDELKFPTTIFNGEMDPQTWLDVAIEEGEQLKGIGVNSGLCDVQRLAREHFGMKLGDSQNKSITNFDDVITTIGNQNWYNEDKDKKRRIIYRLMYGLFRQGLNGWLRIATHDWMKSKNITLATTITGRLNETTAKPRRAKLYFLRTAKGKRAKLKREEIFKK